MEKTYKISEMTWEEFDTCRKTVHTVILPTGAMESYGPHLPLATDSIVAEEIAVRVAKKTGAVVAPLLPVGDSLSLSEFPGTLCVRPESFKEYLRGVVESLLRWDFRNFLFINGHAGNVAMIQQLSAEMQMADSSLQFSQIDWWRYAQRNGKGIFDTENYMSYGHASECGTSVMLYLRPDLVRMDKIRCEVPKVSNAERFPGVMRTTPFSEFSDRSMIGDATKADASKGKKLVDKCVEQIAAYMKKDF